jgi:hypothetical protein
MTDWGRAGVRLTPAEAEERRRRHATRAQQDRAARAEQLEQARQRWARGLIRPWYITAALDMRGLDGPDVDLWEAGEIYPTFDQLCALADLTEMLPIWFVTDHRPVDDAPIFICGRGRRMITIEPRPLVATFKPAEITAATEQANEFVDSEPPTPPRMGRRVTRAHPRTA